MRIRYVITILFLATGIGLNAQMSLPFQFQLEPLKIEGFSGLQSYAWAKNADKVLLIGGRTDGLHRRQPFAAFNKQYNNLDLIVIDLKNGKTWKQSLKTLPPTIAEQMQSTNMEFFQQGNHLLLIGGYGYSESKKKYITHPSLIRIKVKEMINAVVNNKNLLAPVSFLTDERMAVTGGRLNKLGNLFYLTGGQRFDGRYNPHGPDHGPGFSQHYTNQIRKFRLTESGNQLQIEDYSAITDSLVFHRRDYNLLTQYDQAGKEILTIYSGVFQYNKDIPYKSLVDITNDNYKEVASFSQQFNHYHTATLPVYSHSKEIMYSVFFGGIAQNYPDSFAKIITDDNVPFVKTISVVERNKSEIKEYALPQLMPGYFGAGAEFVPADKKLFFKNGILNLDKIAKRPILAGYIIGGIESKASNVFWNNSDNEPSIASPVIWKIYIKR